MSDVWIKICGITREADAIHAAKVGAHAVGFNFYQPSPRYVAPERVAEWQQILPEIQRVGVFVNHSREQVRAIAEMARLDILQFHGDEPDEWLRDWPEYSVIKAIRLRENTPLHLPSVDGMLLLDAYAEQSYGGTGARISRSLLTSALSQTNQPIIIAGGLTPDSVAAVVSEFQPFGVDVASGVESAPGIKDPEKVSAFVRAVQTAR